MLCPKDYQKVRAPMPLAFSLPGQRTAPPKDLEVRPKHVKAWLESLPLAQSVDAAKKLTVHLAALNRARLDPDDRLQILEAYRPIATVVIDELDAIYAKATLPLSPKVLEALTLTRDFAGELATGYKIAIDEAGTKLLSFGAKKQLPLQVMRAMEYVAAQLRAAYKSYTPVPAGVWLDLHQLYLYGEQERVVAEIADTQTKEAAINVYVECLLLSLTDPYRLTPGEVDKVIAQVRTARAPVTLSQARPWTKTSAHFIVPCDTDKPPKPALSANDDNGGPNWRLLDCNPLVDKIALRRQAAEAGNVTGNMRNVAGPESAALLSKLEALWGDPPKRANRRDPADTTVAICVGIKAIGHFTSLEPRDPDAERAALRDGITMPNLRPYFAEAPVFEYDVVNTSEGGLKLRRSENTPHQLAVGEVVGIKRPGKVRWTIGVVRWITAFEEGGMEFGLQYLAPSARMITMQPTIGAAGTQGRTALVLHGENGLPTKPKLVLAPANTYSELREFELDESGTLSRVRARTLREKTGRFDFFEVLPS